MKRAPTEAGALRTVKSPYSFFSAHVLLAAFFLASWQFQTPHHTHAGNSEKPRSPPYGASSFPTTE